MNRSPARRFALIVALGSSVMAALLVAGHFGIALVSRIEAPAVVVPAEARRDGGGIRRVGASYARAVGSILEARLVGSPERIGHAHTRLLYAEMIETERVVWELLQVNVPNGLARLLLLDVAQLRFRRLSTAFSEDRLREIAAASLAFDPDPFADRFDTFQRFVYLGALYDIALSFERSPLIGCTTFTFSGAAAGAGHPLLARAFDFDVHDVFDRKKVVFLVREDGKIPYASVAWPGLVGVVSGMNTEGLAVVVHGARAGEPRAEGEPVVHALRRVLATARSTREAVDALSQREPMVSHVVIALDGSGAGAKVERVPGYPQTVLPLEEARVVTNHLDGPLSSDPKNERVRATTTTLDRESRGREILAELRGPVSVAAAVGALRDRKGVGGKPLPSGDRRAIDADIATHGVVMDTGARVLWVSESPHLSGPFVAFELPRLLAEAYDPASDTTPRAAIGGVE